MNTPTVGQSAIRGRIVTMDGAATVIPDGVVYIAGTTIAAVLPAAQTPPAGFEGVRPLRTGGTVYPGLIELHNHLSYNCLQLWQVPQKFSNRGQWSAGPGYRRLISGPMQVIGKTPSLVPALVRYVEAKCLVAGVTTSQGIALCERRRYPHVLQGRRAQLRVAGRPGAHDGRKPHLRRGGEGRRGVREGACA